MLGDQLATELHLQTSSLQLALSSPPLLLRWGVMSAWSSTPDDLLAEERGD